jgi:hypothetical protein
MCISTPGDGAWESAQTDFSHGLLEFCTAEKVKGAATAASEKKLPPTRT